MFCQKCWREIPGDSAFCAYCGVPIPPEARDLDWEEAQRLEQGRAAIGQVAVSLQRRGSARTDRAQGDDCVVPGAQRKQCLRCHKDMPSSAIEDYCAICTMRREQEEAKRNDAVREQLPRYALPAPPERTKLQKDARAGEDWDNTSRKGKGTKRTWRIVITLVIIFSLLRIIMPFPFTVLGDFVGDVFGGGGTYETVVETVVEDLYDSSYDESDAAYDDEYTDMEDTEVENTWQDFGWEERDASSADFETQLLPLVPGLLSNAMEYLMDFPSEFKLSEVTPQWQSKGVLNRIVGTAVCKTDDMETELAFDLVVTLCDDSEDLYLMCFGVELEGVGVINQFWALDSDGTLSEQGEELWEMTREEYLEQAVSLE